MSGQEDGRPHDGPGPETSENAFALAFPKGDESFPVLKAFQEFLDAERERARRRQMTLTICFMSAIVVLVVLFCAVGAVLFSGMMRRSDAQQAQMLDILMQRMPPAVAQAPAVQPAPAPAPVVAAQPDPQVSELLEVVKSLQAQNAEMMTALQERIREPAPAAKAPVAPAAPSAAETAATARKTGIYSSPRRKPEPAPEPPGPGAEAPVSEEPAAEAPAPEEAAEVPETPSAEESETPAAEKPEPPAEAPAAEASGAEESHAKPGPVQMKIVRSRDMHAPAGYSPEQITIVSSGNVKFPWRVLMPTGTNTAEAAR